VHQGFACWWLAPKTRMSAAPLEGGGSLMQSALCPKSIPDQRVCFAVRLEDEKAVVRTRERDPTLKKRSCGD
jgi:hypothetical protein